MNRIVLALLGLLFSTLFVHAETSDPYPLSQDEILLVQAQLYQLNYDVVIDGELTSQTRIVIAAWQANTGRPATGFLTKEEYDFIIAYNTSGYWGSIAASTDGSIHTVWNHTNRLDSVADALAGCRIASAVPGNCFVVSNASYAPEFEAWVAAILCSTSKSDEKYIALASEDTESEVRMAALEFAETKGDYDKCEIRAVVEARGRHK